MEMVVTEALREAAALVARLGADCDGAGELYSAMTDAELLAAKESIATYRKQGELHAAYWAAEIAHRSRRELGYGGLAQQNGFATPEAMVQSETGSTRPDAVRLVAVGTMMADTHAAEKILDDDPASPFATLPWLSPVAHSVAAGKLTLDAAEAIRRGLGDVDAGVPADKLMAAAQFLVREAESLNADQLLRRARALRDQLDEEGIARRTAAQREARSFRIWRQPDGMYRVSALLDPEDGRFLELVHEQATSPKRGGPRFVDALNKARADEVEKDERSTEQVAADALIALVRLGVNADPGSIIIGHRRPAVRVVVTESSVKERKGHGRLEGSPDPVPFATVERHMCESGQVGVKFDDEGQCVNVGRDSRLFTDRQRVGIAVRDGGCRWPGCDKPSSWSEAHHINQWVRDHGKTDIADGVLLCRFHHMLLHNNHWDILRMGSEYWLRPPRAVDPAQELRAMPTKSPLMFETFRNGGTRGHPASPAGRASSSGRPDGRPPRDPALQPKRAASSVRRA